MQQSARLHSVLRRGVWILILTLVGASLVVNEVRGSAPPDYTVVVTADPLRQSSSLTLVDVREYEKAGALTVGDALRMAPEVWVVVYGTQGSVEKVGIAGVYSEPAVILLDGVRVVGAEAAALFALPIQEIRHIEVIPRHGVGASAGTAGAINVVTTGAPVRGHQAWSFSGFSHRDVRATEGGRWGDTEYVFSMGSEVRDRLDLLGYDRDRYLRTTLTREFSSDSESRVHVSWFSTERAVPASSSLQVAPAGTQTYSHHVGVEYTHWQAFAQGELQTSVFARAGQEGGVDADAFHADDISLGGALQATFDMNFGHVVAGVRRENDRRLRTAPASENLALNHLMVYTDFTTELGGAAEITTGVAWHDYSEYGRALSPHVSLVVDTSSDTALRASAYHSYTPPTFSQIEQKGVGTPSLQPAEGWDYEVGVRRHVGASTWDLGFSRAHTKNLIHRMPDAMGVYRPVNIASATQDTIHVALSTPMRPGWLTTVQVSLLGGRDRSTDTPIPYMPSHAVQMGLHYSGGTLHGDITAQYIGEAGAGFASRPLLTGRLRQAPHRDLELYVEGVNLLNAEGIDGSFDADIPDPTVWLGASLRF